jgi:hypothetical protein
MLMIKGQLPEYQTHFPLKERKRNRKKFPISSFVSTSYDPAIKLKDNIPPDASA